MTNFKRIAQFIGAIAIAAVSAQSAFAQQKITKLILPVGAGSGVDVIVRSASKALETSLGTAVVVENQPGAGGIVGTQAITKASPDGLTLGVVSNNHVINPSVYKSLPFDPIKDITPIAVIGQSSMTLVVNPKLGVSDAKSLAAALRAKPDAYNFASSGNGTILHLAAEMFLSEANVKAKHVPYKGVGPMVTDLLGGQVEFGVLALQAVQPHLKSGALKAIGVASKERNPAAADIPTFAEQGFPNYIADGWFAVIGPKGMSAAEAKRVQLAFAAAFNTPEVKDAMAKQGNTIAVQTPEFTASFFVSEMEKYAKLVKQAGVKLD
ncbi:MAG: tripartite tricarboxylate transporter substrate binding protein [Burkholderiales bacterium]|nr:MAG: tripartite tricarboxylate transporter substrate binding protein [Burkholderiales bacterium]